MTLPPPSLRDTSPKSDWGSSDLGEGRVGVVTFLLQYN